MPHTTADITFTDRREAGERLAEIIAEQQWTEPVVLGLARGGVPVADVLAERLGAPLDAIVARKIGAPGHPEFGVGAVTADGPAYYDDESLRRLGLRPDDLTRTCEAEREEARRRVRQYHGEVDRIGCRDRDVLVVDDGLATGVTATAALRAVAEEQPRRAVFAAPVCAPESAERLRREADDVICVATPAGFGAVGMWYRDFRQTTDEQVVTLLAAACGRTLGE